MSHVQGAHRIANTPAVVVPYYFAFDAAWQISLASQMLVAPFAGLVRPVTVGGPLSSVWRRAALRLEFGGVNQRPHANGLRHNDVR